MSQKIIDLSIFLENDVISDPPVYRPKIDYIDHRMSVPELVNFFPGLKGEEGEGDLLGGGPDSIEQDELYDEAVKIVTTERKPSISYVQRRLKIGYNRAARLLEGMEAAGIVGQLQANGSREVLVPAPQD